MIYTVTCPTSRMFKLLEFARKINRKEKKKITHNSLTDLVSESKTSTFTVLNSRLPNDDLTSCSEDASFSKIIEIQTFLKTIIKPCSIQIYHGLTISSFKCKIVSMFDSEMHVVYKIYKVNCVTYIGRVKQISSFEHIKTRKHIKILVDRCDILESYETWNFY